MTKYDDPLAFLRQPVKKAKFVPAPLPAEFAQPKRPAAKAPARRAAGAARKPVEKTARIAVYGPHGRLVGSVSQQAYTAAQHALTVARRALPVSPLAKQSDADLRASAAFAVPAQADAARAELRRRNSPDRE